MKKYLIFLVEVLTIIVLLSSFAFAEGENSLPEKEVKDQLSYVDQLLSEYKRDSAYEALLKLKEEISFEKYPIYYLEVLSKEIALEEFYDLLDKAGNSAMELYEISDDIRYYKYRCKALNTLAYIDYYNYDSEASFDKLEEMVLLQTNYGDKRESSDYYVGIALLKEDTRDYDEVRECLLTAVKIANEYNEKGFLGIQKSISIYPNLAATYYDQKNYALAITTLSSNEYRIDAMDYELRFIYDLFLGKYYYLSGNIKEAKNAFNNAKGDYTNASELFKNDRRQSELDAVEAGIALAEGDYKQAATMYSKLYNGFFKQSQESLDTNLSLAETSNESQNSMINKQLSLLEQLHAAQAKTIQSYRIGFVVTFCFVFMVLIAVIIINNQRRRFYHLSVTDQLTNVANRRSIMEIFSKISLKTKCIAMIDLDHFKMINDTYGHLVGDAVLEKVAKTVKESIRNNDLLGRYGGEEFLLILDTTSIEVALEVTERIRAEIENIHWPYENMKTTISIGLVRSNSISGDVLLKEADRMLYESKSMGRNRVTYEVLD